MDILVSGYVGLGYSLKALKDKKESLLARFPEILFDRLDEYRSFADSSDVEAALREKELSFVAIGKDGLYKGLWELGETFNTGISVHLEAVPILQETVEISEFLGDNPYMSDSEGCVVIMAEDGEKTGESLKTLGIKTVLIGTTTAGNDRVVFYDENVLYLTP